MPTQNIIGQFKSYTTKRYNELNNTKNIISGGNIMKKLILGIGMMISGVIGITGCIISSTIQYPDISCLIFDEGMQIPVILFTLLALSGLITSIVGASKNSK